MAVQSAMNSNLIYFRSTSKVSREKSVVLSLRELTVMVKRRQASQGNTLIPMLWNTTKPKVKTITKEMLVTITTELIMLAKVITMDTQSILRKVSLALLSSKFTSL